MTDLTAATIILEQLGLDESHLPRVVALIQPALKSFALRAKTSPEYEGMQRDFDATPAAGRFDLATLAGLLFDLRRATVRVASSGVVLRPFDDLLTLRAMATDTTRRRYAALSYAQEGTRLVFTDAVGVLDAYATALKIHANFVPASLAELPAEYEKAFLATLAEEVLSHDIGKQTEAAVTSAMIGRA